MVFGQTPRDWLVVQLVERCKEGSVVDEADLILIVELNVGPNDLPRPRTHSIDFGEIIQKLGKRVVAQSGRLVVPTLQDYARTETLQAPAEWLQRWSKINTLPATNQLWAAFDITTAVTPEGRPMMIDGPGAHSFESWMNYCNERDRILEQRRLRRVAAGW